MSQTARYFVSLALGFVAYRIAVEFVGLVALLVGVIVVAVVWALLRAWRPAPTDRQGQPPRS